MSSSSRLWVFTYYGECKDPAKHFESKNEAFKAVTEVGWQQESCPTTKRLHLQGYAYFNEKITLKKVQDILGIPGAHCEIMKGGIKASRNYCSKRETRVSGPWCYTQKEAVKAASKHSLPMDQWVKYLHDTYCLKAGMLDHGTRFLRLECKVCGGDTSKA